MSLAHKGKVFSEESKRKMSESTSGKNHPMWGKKHSRQTLERIRIGNLGKNVSDETRERISKNHADVSGAKNPRARAINQLDPKTGEILRKFKFIKEVEDFDFNAKCVGAVCNGKRNTSGGFKWEFSNDK